MAVRTDGFDEAHLQSLASSLGKKQNAGENEVNEIYVKDPQCHGESTCRTDGSNLSLKQLTSDNLRPIDCAETFKICCVFFAAMFPLKDQS